MKKLHSIMMLLALMVAAFSFTACSDDDDDFDDGGENISDFIGTWSLTHQEGWGTDDTVPPEEYVQFKSDGTYINVQDNDEEEYYISKGNWKVENSELIMKETEGGLVGATYTYTILSHSKDKITLAVLGLKSYLERVPDSTIDRFL
jgi:hypothetical protein